MRPPRTPPRLKAIGTGLRHALAGFAARRRLAVSRRISRLVVLACLFLSILLFNYANKFEHLQARAEFARLTAESVESIRARIASYAQVLGGAAAHVAAQDGPQHEAFAAYVGGLDLERNFPGILGIGFVEAVAAADVPALEDELSAREGRAIGVRPLTPQREKAIVTHMVPPEGNAAVIGLDMGFDPERRRILQAARDSRETTLTSRLALVQRGAEEPGYVMARAVHAPADADPGAFLGWVVAPFLGNSALGAISDQLGSAYHLSVFEGGAPEDATHLFSSADAAPPGATGAGRFTKSYVIDLYGRTWSAAFVSTAAFDTAYSSALPEILLALGLMLTAMISLVLRSAALRARSLRTVAELRTRELGARAEENRALLETTVSVVMILDGAGNITFANDAAAALFGCARCSFAGQPFDSYVKVHRSSGPDSPSNAEGLLADGRRLMLDVQSNGWRRADGAAQTTVLIRDVTDQIAGHRAIEALHKRYDIALKGAGIGIFEIDIVTGAAEMSETWHKIMGTDALGVPFDHKTHFLARVHPEDLPALLAADRACITGQTKRSVAEYRMRFGQQWRWMYSDAVPMARGPDGHATRLIGTQSDITALRHARNALEASEALFRMVLEDAPLAMAVLDERGAFVGANAALSKLSGYDPRRLKRDKRLVDLLSRRDYIQMSRDVRGLLRSGAAKTYQNQFQLCTGDGEKRWCLFNLSWTYDKNRAQHVYIAQIVDITEQKRIERIKSEFVATVSHELRTPLTSITGAIGILNATAADLLTEDARRLLEIASINANRLALIVNDILDLERISSGEAEFEFENTCLNDILLYTLAEMSPLAQEHGKTLVLAEDAPEIWVHVDAGRIRQVLGNLLSNACKYSDPGSEVRIACEQRDGDARVMVINTGPPVPERFRETIFEPFTQLESSDTRSKGGTGLGLNIVRQIVLRSNGQVGLEQRGPRETVFWFTVPLPLAAVPAAVPEAPAGALPETPAGAVRPDRRMLLVATPAPDADALAAEFAGLAELHRAADAQGAGRLLGQGTFVAVVMDLALPQDEICALLDILESQHPAAKRVGLATAPSGGADPRFDAVLPKGQGCVAATVAAVLNGTAPARRQMRKAAV